MRKKECPSCGVEIDRNCTVCPLCMYEFPDKPSYNMKIIALILLALFLFPFVKFLINLIIR